MSEDPAIREWFERSSATAPSDAFIDHVMTRIDALHNRMRFVSLAAAVIASGAAWFYRGLFSIPTAYLAEVFAHVGAAMASPLSWILSITVLVAGWSVARCRGWDV
jgi:hypothetical protein